MPNYIEVQLDENTKIYLETTKDDVFSDGRDWSAPAASGSKVIQKAKDFLDDTFNQIIVFSNGIVGSIKGLTEKPDEIEVEFAVKFAADAGIIISSISSEASIKIKLKWIKQREE